jgi:hypothetical protein
MEGAGPPPPLVFDSDVLEGNASALGALNARRRAAILPGPPGLAQLIVGPCGAGSPLHFHPAALNVLLLGVKAWVLVPPAAAGYADMDARTFWRRVLPQMLGRDELRRGRVGLAAGGDAADISANGSDWDSERLESEPADAEEAPVLLRVLQGPGDAVFVPSQWGHAVLDLTDTVATAHEALLE